MTVDLVEYKKFKNFWTAKSESCYGSTLCIREQWTSEKQPQIHSLAPGFHIVICWSNFFQKIKKFSPDRN